MFPISAEHGRGVDDLLDAVLKSLPEKNSAAEGTDKPEELENQETATATEDVHEVKVAIIGHPNVGKSTLLNCLTASDRAIVSPIPGTTRDAVDEIVEHNGRSFRFIDTAGIRRKGKTHLMAEKLSVVMARKHLEGADIALLVVDATEGVSQLDASIAGYAHESGRSIIIVVNKWDLVISGAEREGRPTKAERMRESKRPGDREAYEQRLRYELKFLNYAPIVFVSARSGKGTEKNLADARKKLQRTPQACDHLADEPLPRARRLRTRLRPGAPARQDSLYDAGICRPPYIRALHQPRRKAPLFLSALFGKPNPRSLRLRRHTDLDQEPSQRVGGCSFSLVSPVLSVVKLDSCFGIRAECSA